MICHLSAGQNLVHATAIQSLVIQKLVFARSVNCHAWAWFILSNILQDCEHNTLGDHCDQCKSGYIGDAREGGANACTKCACPLVENSFRFVNSAGNRYIDWRWMLIVGVFSDTCVAVDYGRGYVCNACKPGYTGQYCERSVSKNFDDDESIDKSIWLLFMSKLPLLLLQQKHPFCSSLSLSSCPLYCWFKRNYVANMVHCYCHARTVPQK